MKYKKPERMKPKSSLSSPNADELIQNQDRIEEKLSISIPAPKLPPRPNPGLAGYMGLRVRMLFRDGIVMIATFTRMQWDFLRLDKVEEIGKDYKLTADWCFVQADSIVRLYPADAKVEEISKP